jgi:hypothetical protein
MRDTPFGRSATYDPNTLHKLGEIFESAWASIASNFTSGSREPARLQLATIILEFAADGDSDPL